MKINIYTSNPTRLWDKIKKTINEKKIETWTVVLDSKKDEYLTHTPAQWFKKALLKPSITINPAILSLTVLWFTDSVPTEYTKGLYIGRFTEELLEHFRSDFTKLETFA